MHRSRRPILWKGTETMTSLALATDSDHPDLTGGDRRLVERLSGRGIESEPVIWNSDADWSQYDAVIVRSTWNYVENRDAYLEWIDRLDGAEVQLWNPADVLRWNMNKLYLKDLRKAGHSIVPSVFVPERSSIPIERVLEEKDWSEFILKPMVGAGASGLEKFTRDSLDEAQAWLDELVGESGAIIQPYLDSVRKNGEWSFVFFNRDYRYAVKKYPTGDDYRVQAELGGSREGEEAPPAFVRQAEEAVNSITKPFLYARVDALEQNGQLRIIEIEMIEPDLYLEYAEEGPQAFADAIEEVLEQGARIDYFDHAEIQTEGRNGGSLN